MVSFQGVDDRKIPHSGWNGSHGLKGVSVSKLGRMMHSFSFLKSIASRMSPFFFGNDDDGMNPGGWFRHLADYPGFLQALKFSFETW